jgi:hypothetical protein
MTKKSHAVLEDDQPYVRTLCGIQGPLAQSIRRRTLEIVRGRDPVDCVVAHSITDFECAVCRRMWRSITR